MKCIKIYTENCPKELCPAYSDCELSDAATLDSPLDGMVSKPSWQELKNNNHIVASVVKAGGDTTDCVIALAEQNGKLLKRIMELENIAPRQIKVGEQTLIWRCPAELVPAC